MTCRPGHPPRHPDFEPGNVVAVKHGAWSPRHVDPLATELVEQVTTSVDWLRPCDSSAVWAWARCEARVQLVTQFLMDHGGDLGADDATRRASDLLTRLEARAESLRSKLGFDPFSVRASVVTLPHRRSTLPASSQRALRSPLAA